jgi:hypothetical protein
MVGVVIGPGDENLAGLPWYPADRVNLQADSLAESGHRQAGRGWGSASRC